MDKLTAECEGSVEAAQLQLQKEEAALQANLVTLKAECAAALDKEKTISTAHIISVNSCVSN